MSTLDWQCSDCGAIREDLSGYTSKNPPTCEACPAGNSMEILWRSSRISAWEKPLKFWDEHGNEHEAKSIADVRRFEKECEHRFQNGEGKRMIARDFSQDHNNMLDRANAQPQVKPHPYTQSGRKIVIRRGTGVQGEHGRG